MVQQLLLQFMKAMFSEKVFDRIINLPTRLLGVVSSQLAGNWLSQALLKQLTGKGVTIRPRYLISKHDVQPGQFVVEVKDFPHVTQSYHNYTVNVFFLKMFLQSLYHTRILLTILKKKFSEYPACR